MSEFEERNATRSTFGHEVPPEAPVDGKARHFAYMSRFEDQGDGSRSALFDQVARKQVANQRHLLKAPVFEPPVRGKLELRPGTYLAGAPRHPGFDIPGR